MRLERILKKMGIVQKSDTQGDNKTIDNLRLVLIATLHGEDLCGMPSVIYDECAQSLDKYFPLICEHRKKRGD